MREIDGSRAARRAMSGAIFGRSRVATVVGRFVVWARAPRSVGQFSDRQTDHLGTDRRGCAD